MEIFHELCGYRKGPSKRKGVIAVLLWFLQVVQVDEGRTIIMIKIKLQFQAERGTACEGCGRVIMDRMVLKVDDCSWHVD